MTRQEILDQIDELDAREHHLNAEARRMLQSLTGDTGTWIAGVLTVGGLAASWATFGISLGVSVLGAAWFAKETVDKKKAKNRFKKINDELAVISQQRENLEALLSSMPPT